MDVLFLADPWETLDHHRDTTLYLGKVARQQFGAKTFWAVPNAVRADGGKLKIVLSGELTDAGLTKTPDSDRTLGSFHSIHWRADPPVTVATLRLWSLLTALEKQGATRFVNPPASLLKWNEKFAPLAFGDMSVETLVSNDESAWLKFYQDHASTPLIAKPCSEAASRGVHLLPLQNDVEALKVLRQLRERHGDWLVIQRFDERITTEGETRAFLINGRIAGTFKKQPRPGHPVMNMDLPENERPTLSIGELSTEQLRRAEVVARTLSNDGVYIATIDFIGEKILEVNVTSPGLIRWYDEQRKDMGIATEYWKGLLV